MAKEIFCKNHCCCFYPVIEQEFEWSILISGLAGYVKPGEFSDTEVPISACLLASLTAALIGFFFSITYIFPNSYH